MRKKVLSRIFRIGRGGIPGFDYPGGRIAQRAYYDSLRDTAH